MTRKRYLRKRAYLMIKVSEYSKKYHTSSEEVIKRANKVTWKQQLPDMNVYHSYQEAYDALYEVLRPIVEEVEK